MSINNGFESNLEKHSQVSFSKTLKSVSFPEILRETILYQA